MTAWDRIATLFREAYEQAATETVGAWTPVLEVRPDRVLALRTDDGEIEVGWEPDAAECDLRTLSHLPLLLYLGCHMDPDGAAALLEELAEMIHDISTSLDDRPLSPGQRERNRRLVNAVGDFLARDIALDAEARSPVSELASSLRPIIDANLADAAALNLDSLQRAIDELLEHVDDEALERLVVLNRGNKSARIGNQVDLYMTAVLGEEAAEQRLVFAEGITDQERVRQVLGEYLLDRAIGFDFFGDALSMRSDVLSSPTQEEMARRIAEGSVPQRRPGHAHPDGRQGADKASA